ncbi:MAG: hypothetical protein ABW208_16010 [Pyrinomonadaceae bacterium]
MKATTTRLLLLLPWLSLPLILSAHLLLWERIPERLAVQFDSSGAVSNWMTRGQSLAFDLAILLLILVTSTLKLYRQGRTDRPSGLFILNVAVVFVTLIFLGLLKYNITGSLF